MDKPAVVVTQPTTVHGQYAGEKPNNYLVASVINLICCFFLLGIIALIFSLQVDSAWALGNYEKAKRNANISKIFNIIGFIIGALLWLTAIISIIVSIVLVVTGSGTCSYSTVNSTIFECSYSMVMVPFLNYTRLDWD